MPLITDRCADIAGCYQVLNKYFQVTSNNPLYSERVCHFEVLWSRLGWIILTYMADKNDPTMQFRKQ